MHPTTRLVVTSKEEVNIVVVTVLSLLGERPTPYLSLRRLLLVDTAKPTLRSLAILMATKIQKTKKKIALSIGDYFKIVSYLSEQFLMQFDWGWS